MSSTDKSQHNKQVITQMVMGFSNQDRPSILALFADQPQYHDVNGGQTYGRTYKSKAEIDKALLGQFSYLLPKHTYIDPIIFAEGDRVCASWTLVLGSDRASHKQYHIRGCDYFLLQDGKVIEKCAFVKANTFGFYSAILRLRTAELLRQLWPLRKKQVLV